MSRITISIGKFNRLQACANERGVISALAVDQRGSLRKSFTQFRPEIDPEVFSNCLCLRFLRSREPPST